jgi:hypothetical protein
MVYWATETSAVGRRRLVATADKRFYHPGETVAIAAQAYDEAATRTNRYRIVAALEPRKFDGTVLPPCPVKWPGGRARAPGESGTLVGWGEEIALTLNPQTKDYSLPLPLVDVLAAAQSEQSFRMELTAYEGETQIDSSSIDVQILSDPYEQQNPLPNREFLAALARATGGREFHDPKDLANALTELRMGGGPPSVRHTPLWSRWEVLVGLLGLLGVEWFGRRWLGLA